MVRHLLIAAAVALLGCGGEQRAVDVSLHDASAEVHADGTITGSATLELSSISADDGGTVWLNELTLSRWAWQTQEGWPATPTHTSVAFPFEVLQATTTDVAITFRIEPDASGGAALATFCEGPSDGPRVLVAQIYAEEDDDTASGAGTGLHNAETDIAPTCPPADGT